MNTSVNSLVKYDSPHSSQRNGDKKEHKTRVTPAVTGPSGPLPSHPPTKTTSDIQRSRQIEEILNKILPPREWAHGGQSWRQCVSSGPASRQDVVELEDQIDTRLLQRQARDSGICPIRRELFSECFDELIRQVTIDCAERGLLLLKVRDEIKMTLAAYQTLYESSVAFGTRKSLEAEQGRSQKDQDVKELEEKRQQLEKKLADEKRAGEENVKRDSERRKLEEAKHQDELQFLKKTNQQLKQQLEGIRSSGIKK
ncbi:33 kDa inner dynein arm light chain, axonemal-like [Oopsacas minuta]|uniref:33 kDa inner dynein arm light chain, axonemal-like n=1 Tax=Oopsacas minuta TaxID=111878 RepID=A0AAV7JWP0_9METZ|nr:33 kDa inner dynein arm light chain, axonemal-like [Oopsacas minuta]